jgi:hypothetical protein
LPASQSPSGSSESHCSTPGVVDSTCHASDSTISPGALDPSASTAWPTSRARRAPAATALAKAEPKTLRYRLLHVAARLTRGQRRRWLRIGRRCRWAIDLARAFARVAALPQPAT